jgi:glycosyltransferase involved in cell wall biosynthesis
LRVLYTNPSNQLGGAERSLLDIICAIRQQDPSIEVIVLITTSNGSLQTELKLLGVQVILQELPKSIALLGDSGLPVKSNKITLIIKLLSKISIIGELIQYWRKFRQTIIDVDADIIHSNGLKTHLFVASLGISTPIIWHLRDYISPRPQIRNLLKIYSRNVSVGVAISKSIALDWQKVFPKLPVKLVYNGIDTDLFKPKLVDPAIDPNFLRIGLVATYSIWKGHEIFIQAIKLIADEQPELISRIKFYIIGGAIYQTNYSQYAQSELIKLAREFGIEDWLIFINFQNEIVQSYNMLDIVVHASTLPEPFGRTVVEAMACEKATIITNSGGVTELFTHNINGIGVVPKNPDALAIAIRDLIDSPAKRLRIGKAGRMNVVERFNRRRLGEELILLYSELINEQDSQ